MGTSSYNMGILSSVKTLHNMGTSYGIVLINSAGMHTRAEALVC